MEALIGEEAMRVQAAIRGSAVRKQIAAQETASLTIQAGLQGYEARKGVAAQTGQAASHVQAVIRGAEV